MQNLIALIDHHAGGCVCVDDAMDAPVYRLLEGGGVRPKFALGLPVIGGSQRKLGRRPRQLVCTGLEYARFQIYAIEQLALRSHILRRSQKQVTSLSQCEVEKRQNAALQVCVEIYQQV